MTPLVAASDGPPSPDPFGDEDVPWPGPECLRGEIAVGFSRLVYEGGSVDDLVTCGRDGTSRPSMSSMTGSGSPAFWAHRSL